MSMPVHVPMATGGGVRASIQRLGGFLAGMVIPNIGAFIAWGLITAFVIPTGWTPNEHLAELVGPMITFLLPILIGYTGGYLVHGQRGAVVGAIVMGPLGGFVIKEFDSRIESRIPTGFEMLVRNFSAGIIGGGLAVLAFLAIGPVVEAI